MWVWSANNNNFFPASDVDKYVSAGWSLDDAITVTDDVFTAFHITPLNGKMRIVGSDGMPAWGDIPPPTHEELVAAADNQKDRLLSEAQTTISLWQTELQLDSISDADKARLITWVNYIKAVQAVDASTAPDINWPEPPFS